MSKSKQKVLVSTGSWTVRHYHYDKTCANCPENYREVELHKVKPTHNACGSCVPGATGDSVSTRNEYCCQRCGTKRNVASQAARKRHACQSCNAVTSHERVDNE